MRKTKILVAGTIVVTLLVGTTVFASSTSPGSTSDPLVTKSYVDSKTGATKTTELESQLKTANTKITNLEKKVAELEKKVNTGSAQSTTPSTPSTPAPTTKTGKVSASSLNVRSNAGTSYKTVGSVKSGTIVTILASKKVGTVTWYQIKSGTLTGWVHGGYLTNIK